MRIASKVLSEEEQEDIGLVTMIKQADRSEKISRSKVMAKLDRIPDKLREHIFDKLFETAEIAKFTQDQIRSYEDSLKYYRDLKNSLDTAKEEGKVEVALEMLKANESIDKIIRFTGLSKDQIEKLK